MMTEPGSFSGDTVTFTVAVSPFATVYSKLSPVVSEPSCS
jgi:hypothetical protein